MLCKRKNTQMYDVQSKRIVSFVFYKEENVVYVNLKELPIKEVQNLKY